MTFPADLFREAAAEAVLADAHHVEVLPLQMALEAATVEILSLVTELENPTPQSTADRRVAAMRIAAQLMRSGRILEDWAL